jgi:hypothetical protein
MSEEMISKQSVEHKKTIKSFISCKQWADKYLKEKPPENLKIRLNTILRNFSNGMIYQQDLRDAKLYIEKISLTKKVADGAVGKISPEKTYYKE